MRNLRQHAPSSPPTGVDCGLNVMFLAAFPLVLWLFQGSFSGMASALLQMGMFVVALRLICKGQEIQQRYNMAPFAKRPKLPRKLLGSGLIGVVVFLLAGHQFTTLGVPTLLAIIACILSVAAFGPDPLRDKGLDDPALMNRLAAEQSWDAAETALINLTDQLDLLDDPEVTLKSEATRAMVLRLMRSFGPDPQNVTRISKLVDKLTEILRAETERLQKDWYGDKHLFARKRFLLKLETLSESFESYARQGSELSGRDAFDLEADLILDRMQQKAAA